MVADAHQNIRTGKAGGLNDEFVRFDSECCLGSDKEAARILRRCSGSFGERLNRGSFILLDIKHTGQFGDLQ